MIVNVLIICNFFHLVFIEHAKILSKILKESSQQGIGQDMQEIFARYTLDSIIKVAFGEDLHSLEHPVEFGQVFGKKAGVPCFLFFLFTSHCSQIRCGCCECYK